jgi:hypothetical protein
MAVKESQSGTCLDSLGERSLKVVWKEARVTVNAALAFHGKKQSGYKTGPPLAPLTGIPEREAEVFLAVGTKEMLLGCLVDRCRKRGAVVHGSHWVSKRCRT